MAVVFFAACNEGKLEKTNQLMAKNEIPVTEEMNAALEEAIGIHIMSQKGMADTKSLGEELKFPGTQEEFDALEFTALPLYYIDAEVFMEDLGTKKLHEAIKPSPNKMLFLAKRDGRMAFLMGITKTEDGHWLKNNLGNTEYYFNRDFSQLPELLEQIDDNRFYFMDYFGHLILAYQKDGESYYASSVNDEKYAQKEGAFIENTLRQLQQNTEQ